MGRFGLTALLAMLVVAGASAQPGKAPDISLERQGATDLLARVRTAVKEASGQDVELGEHPFHYVFLVDSSRAASRSPETLFVRNLIGQFLNLVSSNEDARNVGAENRSLASVYPYQRDLYKGDGETVKAIEITKENTSRITDAVPQTHFKTRPNGTPYVNDPVTRNYDGHDNVQPRRDLLDLLGVETRRRPVVLVQITTNPLNEAPTDPKVDQEIRKRQSRTALLEGTGFKPYGAMQLASRHSPDAVQVHFWTYGPDDTTWRTRLARELIKHPARGATLQKAAPPGCPAGMVWDEAKQECVPIRRDSGSFLWVIPVLVLLVGAGAAAWWWFGAKLQLNIEDIPVTLRRGQEVALVAEGGSSSARTLVLPTTKVAGAPAGTLAVLRMQGSQAVIEGRACTVALSCGTVKPFVPLKVGPTGNQITLAVKGGFTTTIMIKVLG